MTWKEVPPTLHDLQAGIPKIPNELLEDAEEEEVATAEDERDKYEISKDFR